MADIKISELGAASAVNATDLFPMTSSGVTVKATAQQIKNYMGVGNITDLDTTDKSSTVAAINEVNTKGSKTEVLISNVQQMIAPILTSLVAPSGGLESGDQFIYNGLLYKATATIAQGGTITIGGNCSLADSVTEQINALPVTGTTISVAVDTTTTGDKYIEFTAAPSTLNGKSFIGYIVDSRDYRIGTYSPSRSAIHVTVFNAYSGTINVSLTPVYL